MLFLLISIQQYCEISTYLTYHIMNWSLGFDPLLLYTLGHYFLCTMQMGKLLPNCDDWDSTIFSGVKNCKVIETRFNDVGRLGSDFRHYGHALHFTSVPGWEEQRGNGSDGLSVGLVSNTLVTFLLKTQSLRLSQTKLSHSTHRQILLFRGNSVTSGHLSHLHSPVML